jgi:hypothetical protein
MSLSGNARRWRVLDRMKYTREREQLQAQVAGLNLAILKARKLPNAFERQFTLNSLHDTFWKVRCAWATAKAREESAEYDLGEA